jgi:signal transduction histidine kinase
VSFADIAAITIHDVKNRLAQLAGRAEAQGDRATLRVALEAATTLSALLAFYRTGNGTLPVAIDAHSPAELLAELAVSTALPESLSIATRCDSAPLVGYYDEALVRMVLTNALQNAQRHARARILIGAATNGNYLEFVVHDDGEGYPPAVLADTGASAPISREGTGLGLRLASRVAALHSHAGRSGEVRIANDQGALFRLLLPV